MKPELKKKIVPMGYFDIQERGELDKYPPLPEDLKWIEDAELNSENIDYIATIFFSESKGKWIRILMY